MTKKTTLEQVQEFHETYGLPVRSDIDLSCEQTKQLRINLLQEELDELVNGIMEYLQSDEFMEQLEEAKDGQIESEFFAEEEISKVLNSKISPTIH